MPSKTVPRALIVDDHRVVRLGIRLLLEDYAITVAGEAATGEEALDVFDNARPNVVITDIALGDGMNGVELTRHIKQAHPTVRVLVVSMHEARYLIQKALDAGADGFVVKHNTEEALDEAIESILSGRPYLCKDTRKKVDVNTLKARGGPSSNTMRST